MAAVTLRGCLGAEREKHATLTLRGASATQRRGTGGTHLCSGGSSLARRTPLGWLGPFDSLTFAAIAAGATAAVTYGIIRYRPRPMWVWVCGLGSMLLFFLGGVLREMFGTLGDLSPSREWYPEPFSMLGYIALGVSLFAVARSHLGDRWNDRVATLDALIAGLAALARSAWIFLITPALERENMPFGAASRSRCTPRSRPSS